jgi:hypothetical protein
LVSYKHIRETMYLWIERHQLTGSMTATWLASVAVGQERIRTVPQRVGQDSVATNLSHKLEPSVM